MTFRIRVYYTDKVKKIEMRATTSTSQISWGKSILKTKYNLYKTTF